MLYHSKIREDVRSKYGIAPENIHSYRASIFIFFVYCRLLLFIFVFIHITVMLVLLVYLSFALIFKDLFLYLFRARIPFHFVGGDSFPVFRVVCLLFMSCL